MLFRHECFASGLRIKALAFGVGPGHAQVLRHAALSAAAVAVGCARARIKLPRLSNPRPCASTRSEKRLVALARAHRNRDEAVARPVRDEALPQGGAARVREEAASSGRAVGIITAGSGTRITARRGRVGRGCGRCCDRRCSRRSPATAARRAQANPGVVPGRVVRPTRHERREKERDEERQACHSVILPGSPTDVRPSARRTR